MTVSGQNYGNFQANQSGGTASTTVSLGQWHGNGIINGNTRLYVNTANQNGAEIRATGGSKKGLSIFTSGYGSTALSVQATHSMSNAATFSGDVTFSDKVGVGVSPLYLPAHEQLAIRNGSMTTSGIGNGLSLNGSYYGTNNDFGTQKYGLFMGNGNDLNLSTVQTTAYNPIVLSSFYGLGFDVGLGKMTLCQNGALYIGGNNATTNQNISSIADLDPVNLQYQLHVEKGIRTEKVKVDAKGNWPDYVFELDYNLPTLTEVEVHIKENKHLPDVPSAAQIEKEGIDLGEMDKILLQKIEELTLYTIQQQKQIEQLNSELEKLKN